MLPSLMGDGRDRLGLGYDAKDRKLVVNPAGVDIRLKVEGLTGLVQDLAPRRRVREAA